MRLSLGFFAFDEAEAMILVCLGVFVSIFISLRWLLNLHRSIVARSPHALTSRTWLLLVQRQNPATSHLRGGGSEDKQMEQLALLMAERIRNELGEKVNKPGYAAIKAVLLMRKHSSVTQQDAMKRFPTSKDSLRRYRTLIGRLSADTPPTTAVAELSL